MYEKDAYDLCRVYFDMTAVKPAVRQVKLVVKLYGGWITIFVKNKEHRIIGEEREMCFCGCRYVFKAK